METKQSLVKHDSTIFIELRVVLSNYKSLMQPIELIGMKVPDNHIAISALEKFKRNHALLIQVERTTNDMFTVAQRCIEYVKNMEPFIEYVKNMEPFVYDINVNCYVRSCADTNETVLYLNQIKNAARYVLELHAGVGNNEEEKEDEPDSKPGDVTFGKETNRLIFDEDIKDVNFDEDIEDVNEEKMLLKRKITIGTLVLRLVGELEQELREIRIKKML